MKLSTFMESIPGNVLVVGMVVLVAAIVVLSLLVVMRAKQMKAIKTALYRDLLTGLSSSEGFTRDVEDRLSSARPDEFYIVDFDINHFENLNSVFGYEAGNAALILVGDTLSSFCRGNEACARFSADRFVCLLHAVDEEEIIRRVHNLDTAIHQSTHKYSIYLSYGIYRIVDYNGPVAGMCDKAAIAKREVKGNHEHFIGRYSDDLYRKQKEDLDITTYAARGLRNGEFKTYFQPKYSTGTKLIVGAEALCRWDRPSVGLVYPDRFIPLFETNGLIEKLDFYMVENVAKKIAQMQIEGGPSIPISVNISRAHLHDDALADRIFEVAKRYEIPTECLEIEMTESAFFDNMEGTCLCINKLREYGFTVSMDDFGSGYSSLNLLKDVSFDVLKIDKEFLEVAEDTARGQVIVRDILKLAHDLEIVTVAEGVETPEQFDFLKDHGCDIVQGYLFSTPVPEADFDELLKLQS